jgi:tetratricopeptide (TPR) repeat protein
MSRLYDAIKRIEKKDTPKEAIPNFDITPQKKPPYLLIGVTVIFVIIIIVSAFMVIDRLHYVKQINGISKKTSQKLSKKATAEDSVAAKKRIAKTSIPQKNQNIEHIVINEGKKKPVAKQVAVINKKKIKKNKMVAPTLKKEEKHKVKKDEKLAKKTKSAGEIKPKQEPEFRYTQAESKKESLSSLLQKAESDNNQIAIDAYKKLIKILPNNVSLYNNLAVKYMYLGKYYSAIRVLKDALAISDDDDIKLNLAISYIKIGKYKSAKKYFNMISSENVSDIALYKAIAETLNQIK